MIMLDEFQQEGGGGGVKRENEAKEGKL